MDTSFTLPATGGGSFSKASALGKNLVIFFYPKDDTPGCTTESVQFRDLYAEFLQQDCIVFGISRDSIDSHEKFKKKFSLPFELLSDAGETVCKQFGVLKEKNMYGKQVLGIERSTFVFDKKGALRQEWRKLKADGHAKEVLDYIKTMK
jgi:peroxiredoxin Q/BCP